MALTKVSGDFIQDGSITQGHLHASHGITTSDIGEGSNLYFTTARVDSRIGDLSTSNLSEGTNLYYTQARFNTAFAAKSTSDLSEGTNLYYTDARVGSYLTTNSYATQSYVNTQVSNLVDSAPSTLDTLNELAAALGDDANFSTTVTNSIATKLPLAGGTLTGNLTISGSNTLEVFGFLYTRSTLRVLNAAGTGWHNWATRAAGKYDLNVNNITAAAITASGNVTGANLNISNWDTAYGWGNHASAGYLASSSYTASDVLSKILTVDGSGSGLDADLLDGVEGNQFLRSTTSPGTSGTNANTSISIGDNGTSYAYVQSHGSKPLNFNPVGNTVQIAGNRILTTADEGSGNGIDADTVDGQHASAFASSSHTHAASDITSGNLAAARNTVNLVNIGSTSDASGIYFRSTNEIISGEPWATSRYAYNENDGFLFLNRNSSSTAFPTFHIGGWNNAGYAGYSNADGMITLTRSDGSKSTGSTYAGTGLSNTSYWTRMVKTTAKTIFKDAQSAHEFDGNVQIGTSTAYKLTVAGNGNYMNINYDQIWNAGGNLHLQYSSSGNIDMNAGGGYAFSRTSLRAPVFYDYNNTNYYMDPQSETRLNGFVKLGNSSTYNSDDGSWGARMQVASTVHARIDVAQDANSMRSTWYVHTGHSGPMFGTSTAHPLRLMYNGSEVGYWNGTQLYHNSSVRSPIFYDSNDTGRYVDPNGTSVMNKLNAVYGNTTGTGAPSYTGGAIEIVTSGNYVPAIGFHRGGYSATTLYEYDGELYVNPWTTRDQAGKLLSSGNWSSYVFSGAWNGSNFPGSRWGGFGVNGGEIVFQRDNPSTGKMSIMVDGNFYAGENGGFWSIWSGNNYNNKVGIYGDSSGNLNIGTSSTENILRTNYGYVQVGPMNSSHAHIYTDRSNFYFNKQIQLLGGSLINANDIRAQEFYDLNDTGYYVNPNSSSNFKHIMIGDGNANNGAQSLALNDGELAFRDNADHYHKMWYYDGVNIATNRSHGHVRIWGESSNTLRNSTTGATNLIADFDCAGDVIWLYNDTRSPIFRDSGNTGYYLDPASYSNLSSGRVGSYLQIGTTGNTTHTPGINMAIGSDIYWRQSTYSSNADIWMESVDNATYLTWKLRVSSFDTTSWTDSIVVFNHNFWRGYVGILRSPEYPLDLNGQARLSGGYTTSDVRLKKNIRDNELGLSHLLQLRTRLFDWITDEEILGRTLAFQNSLLDCRGFIAQEVEEVVPELVDTSEGDQPTKSIDDGAVTAMMVKAIQEQQAIIDDLMARIEILENQ